jgi:hypothetical protein
MNQRFHHARRTFLIVIPVSIYICALALLAGRVTLAGPPEIYLIERFLTNQILLHFDTEPNRTYVLQYTDSFTLTSTGVVAHWSNLFTAPSFPFPNHYVIVDSGTAPQRFYRLYATP